MSYLLKSKLNASEVAAVKALHCNAHIDADRGLAFLDAGFVRVVDEVRSASKPVQHKAIAFDRWGRIVAESYSFDSVLNTLFALEQ